MAVPAESYAVTLPAPPAPGGVACTVAWAPGSLTLTTTVTSGGAFVQSAAGQCFALTNMPLPGWQFGNPS